LFVVAVVEFLKLVMRNTYNYNDNKHNYNYSYNEEIKIVYQ